MNRKPNIKEAVLIGNWIEKDGSVIQDSVCEQIQWLIDSYFKLIDVNGNNWSALYKNPDDGSYWELTYPKSHMHGGGPPTLQRISEDEAYNRYNVGSSQ
ncbi:Imm27 family immunity protein [Nitrosomonas sp.]|uniref:Imm27 family immunity protein n=1 Tax=Nitrosomonas sp. TaxID=42353 RepID=UPI001D67D44E|nr:Imm27 family immunity protein [Nitrosomonas sp.]MCB1948201.1 hypothetical protein [Nitrosomonas sp.]